MEDRDTSPGFYKCIKDGVTNKGVWCVTYGKWYMLRINENGIPPYVMVARDNLNSTSFWPLDYFELKAPLGKML